MSDELKPCTFCSDAHAEVIAAVEKMQAALEAAGSGSHPRHHATSMLVKTTLERLLEETGGNPLRVLYVVSTHLTRILGAGVVEVGMLDDAAALTTKDVSELSESELAAMKDLPKA